MFFLTIILAAGAIAAARYAKKTLDMSRKAEREREASNVSAWLQPAKGSSREIEVFVRNGNGGPVYDVGCTIMAKRADKSEPTDEVRVESYISLAPEDAKATKSYTFNMGPDEYVLGVEHPITKVKTTKNGTTTVVFDSPEEWKIWDGQPSTDGLAVDLCFRDSEGQSWHRDWYGRLTQIG